MIVTQPQRKQLYNYLSEVFTYRETLTELYDHILSALENYEGNLPYQEAVTQIIQYDFGGTQKMFELEKKFRRTALSDIRRQLTRIFLYNLLTKGLVLTLIVYLLTVYFKLNLLAPVPIIVIAVTYAVLQIFHYFYRPFRSGYLHGDKKESVKDKILSNMVSIPSRLPWIGLWFDLSKHQITQQAQVMHAFNIALIAVLYVLLPIFVWSYYVAFKNDYQFKGYKLTLHET